MKRRSFIRQLSLVSGTPLLMDQREQHLADSKTATASRVHRTTEGFLLENDAIGVMFDSASGAMTSLHNKIVQRKIAIGSQAAAPLRIWFGRPGEPDLSQAAICRAFPQEPECQVASFDEWTRLCFHWPSFHLPSGQGLIDLMITYALSGSDDFLSVRAQVINSSPLWITGLFLGLEGLVVNEDGSAERLVVADWKDEAAADPRHHLPEAPGVVMKLPEGKRSYSVPSSVPAGLLEGWMDFGDGRGGIGLCYLNKQEMDLVGHVEAQPAGLSLGWRLFRLEGTHGFMRDYNGPRQIYPLAPGEHFQTDEWLIVLHDQDWHQTAEAYRKRYEVHFAGDFLTWDKVSPVVRQCDIVFDSTVVQASRSQVKGQVYDPEHGYLVNRFSDLPDRIHKATEALDLSPENAILIVLGTGPDWGWYRLPNYFPMSELAGGQVEAEQMCRDLKSMGIGGLCFYAHPYFMHKRSPHYTPSAETGLVYPHVDFHSSLGGIACMASDEWQTLWRDEIFPKFVQMGVLSLYWDEGFGHQMICTRPEHIHGSSSLGVLTAQIRGARRLYQSWRNLAGPDAFLLCEGGSDVQARHVELWGFPTPVETQRFTHPDKLIIAEIDHRDVRTSIARALVYGCPVMVREFMGGESILKGEALEALRDYVHIRREIRHKSAPGYPHGFRGTKDLSFPRDRLMACAYADSTGCTVAYFAHQPWQGEIVLDMPGGRRRVRNRIKLSVKATKNEMGYATA
ncbi:MAG: hypothetical protein AB1898_16250 [Acidobacteriota bacterium]